MRSLPLADAHDAQVARCTYCPKLCRHACPVSTAEARETTTPWAKMASLHHVRRGVLDADPSVASTWWACTGCLRCRSFCEHRHEVARTLAAGRAEAVRRGWEPPSVRRWLDRASERERRVRVAATPWRSGAAADPTRVYLPGCSALVRAPEQAEAGFDALRVLYRAEPTVLADRCCGLPWLEAGDPDGFARRARAMLDEIRTRREAVFLDPGCLHALRVIAPSMGIDVPAGSRLRHLVEVAADRLETWSPVELDGAVRYLDPCRLARGLGVVEAPRRLVSHVLGRAPNETFHHGALAECSGQGGLLPVTARGTADAIARERLAEHERAGGGWLLTACPSSTVALRRVGARVLSMADLLRASARREPLRVEA
ncbi:MAG: (Fe-S)-binding protein [Myxococcota bacterium]|nr:(Fe-S)-binding protein [Myxococcota bacterium]MDW8362338.1 (Fe-S)-binding protein [Myxococcales bacterium]